MNCRSCGRMLEQGTRFCPSCGTPSEASCSACGAALPTDAHFCPACGATVEADASGMRAVAPGRERKVATVLFADLVGFTDMGERHDPEVVQALVTRCFDRLADEIRRYEGTIEKFAGDAMLAIFGVPTVHEDDAERAVRAALEMQAAMAELAEELSAEGRPPQQLRIGVESGEVLVDLERAAGERDRMVTGDAVNTAARLQQAAAPGEVHVGASAYAATRLVVDYEEVPPAELKGKSAPVARWLAIAVKARRGGLRAPLGLEAPLIGRDEELGLLKETVRRMVAEDRPHLVTVLGAAGVGKSRLVWELEKYLDGLPETYHWRKGRFVAYGDRSYAALADAVKADARILDDDPPAAAVTKLDRRVAEIGGAEDEPMAAALRGLLGLGPVPAGSREELFDSWRRYLERLAQVAPLVLTFEDIHWADEGSLDAIEYLARWSTAPMLLLLLARHELVERRAAWGGGIANAVSIVLEPLDSAESERLLDTLLPGGMPRVLRDRVVALAGGNPLFAEELARMFVDRGVLRFTDGRWELAQPIEDVEVPGTVHAVLAARLDSLPSAEKRAAQDAAVVGRIFWDALLALLLRRGAAETGQLLRGLRVKELVIPREPSTLAGAAEYGFRHVLIRDVAYDSLPKSERAEKHLAVARWAERELADRADEIAELLASHSLSALRYAEEFGARDVTLQELRRSTLDHARRASNRARRLFQLEEAARWGRVVVELAERLGVPAEERAAAIDEYLTAAEGYEPADVVIEAARTGVELLDALPTKDARARDRVASLRVRWGHKLGETGDWEAARRVLEDGLAEMGPELSHGRGLLLHLLGWTYWRAGPTERATEPLDEALRMARQLGDDEVERWALHDLGIARWLQGDLEGIPLVQESMGLAREAGDQTLLMRCYVNVPRLIQLRGAPWQEVIAMHEEGLAIARRSLDRQSATWLGQNLAETLLGLGRTREALSAAEESLVWAEAIGHRSTIGARTLYIGWIRFAMGEWEAGRRLYAQGLAAYKLEPQFRVYEVTWDAWQDWPDDPQAAVAKLREELPQIEANLMDGALQLARMSLRISDRGALQEAVAHAERAVGKATVGVPAAMRAWIRALAHEPAGAADQIGELARSMEAEGYLAPAADTFADAALVAEREGADPSGWRADADRLYQACELVPLLEVMPPPPSVEGEAAPMVGATPVAPAS